MKEVFILHHVHVLDEDDEDVKIIGIYSSELLAKQAIERAKVLEGFKDAQDGFTVDTYEIDVDNWVEGYITVT